MNNLTRRVGKAVWVAIVALLATCAISGAAMADSHLAQPVGNLVTIYAPAAVGLQHGSFANNWQQVLPDGASKDFQLPAGYWLVVTDVDWIYIAEYSGAPASIFQSEYHLRIDRFAKEGISPLYSSNPQSWIPSPGSAQNAYVIGGHDSLTAGIVVDSVARLSVYMWPQIAPPVSPVDGGKTSLAILHGYLIKAGV